MKEHEVLCVCHGVDCDFPSDPCSECVCELIGKVRASERTQAARRVNVAANGPDTPGPWTTWINVDTAIAAARGD
jgi:hypothetical protein